MKEKKSRLLRTENIPVFWRYFVMMCCMLALMAVAQVVTNRVLTDMVIEKETKETEALLTQNAERLSKDWYALSEIPDIVEGSEYYSLIADLHEAQIPDRYITVPLNIRRRLMTKFTIIGDYTEYVLYFSTVNTVISKNLSPRTPEAFFLGEDRCISYVRTDPEAVLGALKTEKSLTILPVDEVTIQVVRDERCLTVIIHPQRRHTGLLVLYSEESVLKSLGADSFPDGTLIRMTGPDGSYLAGASSEEIPDSGYYEIRTVMTRQEISVSAFIPRSAYKVFSSTTMRSAWLFTGVICLAALVLCVLLSNVLSSPIREIAESFKGDQKERPRNELSSIRNILQDHRQQSEELKKMLRESQMIRLFSGGAVQEKEMEHLRKELSFGPPYRIAVISMPEKFSPLEVTNLLSECLGVWAVTVSRKETDVLFRGDDEALDEMIRKTSLIEADAGFSGQIFRIGVSNEFSDLTEFHQALQQAKMSLPDGPGTGIFSDEENRTQRVHPVSWNMLEQFWQSILNGNETESEEVLRKIAETAGCHRQPALYDSVRYILASASDTMGLPSADIDKMSYDETLDAESNILSLLSPLGELFESMRQKKEVQKASRNNGVLQYMKEQFKDPMLNLYQVAEALGLKEKTVSETVRRLTGQSFQDHLLTLRMQHAANLLIHTDQKIEDIQEACGYTAKSTFFRVFRQYFGQPPKKYREESLNLQRESQNTQGKTAVGASESDKWD